MILRVVVCDCPVLHSCGLHLVLLVHERDLMEKIAM